jgi:multidrug transporter EmrE-like cation transporter
MVVVFQERLLLESLVVGVVLKVLELLAMHVHCVVGIMLRVESMEKLRAWLALSIWEMQWLVVVIVVEVVGAGEKSVAEKRWMVQSKVAAVVVNVVDVMVLVAVMVFVEPSLRSCYHVVVVASMVFVVVVAML